MAFNPPYNIYGQAQFQPGQITEDSHTTRHFAASFDPNPLTQSVTFAGNLQPIVINSSYRIFITDYQGSPVISSSYVMGGTLDLNGFNNFFNQSISGYAQNQSFNPATLWNTASLITLTNTQRPLTSNSNFTIALEKTVGSVVTVVQLVNQGLPSNTGVSAIKYGRFLAYDTTVQNTNALPNNPPFITRYGGYAVKYFDLAEFAANGFSNFAGVSLYNTRSANPYRHASQGTGILETLRVVRKARMVVSNSVGATFANQYAPALYLETAPGPNQATLTNAASATAVLIPNHLIQCVNTRAYPGSSVVAINAV